MARSIRVEYEGAYYHVMARGNRRGEVFLDDEDRNFFVRTLEEACGMTGWKVHAWVLMGNHYHMFIRTPEANLVEGMKWLQNTYTRRFNVRHAEWGRLFGDRYKAMLVEGAGEYYYETMLDYIHLNPVRAGFVNPEKRESVSDYRWSSLSRGYAVPPAKRPAWMACEEGLEVMGFNDTAAGREGMVRRLDRMAIAEKAEDCGIPLLTEEVDARCSHLRRGWYWGTQEFSERMLKMAGAFVKKNRSRGYRAAALRKAHGMDEAGILLREALGAAELKEEDIAGLKAADPRKVAVAWILRKRTIVPNAWLAERLNLQSAANVSQRLRLLDPTALARRVPAKLAALMKNI